MIKCKYCNNKMYLDDEDKKFYGNMDLYYLCEKCKSSLILEIRFNQPYREIWHKKKKDHEEIIKHKIITNRNGTGTNGTK